ncbi:MAG: hypothetical protein IT293_21085 [Deltaproteobacteria bacterium]|nr:hypothetical protein [Deltaproteobacteria bacterium]
MSLAKLPDADVRDDAAALIGEVGRSVQDARRYRALATAVADPVFDRALAIGSEVRRAAREGRSGPIADAVDELRGLLRRCEDGVRQVREGTAYRELRDAYGTSRVVRAAELAAAVFTDVALAPPTRILHWTLPLAARRSPEHFIPPEQCAEAISEIAANGLPAPIDVPDLGGDAAILPIRLVETPDASEGPITLAYRPAVLAEPLGRLTGNGVWLWYAPRLHGVFTLCAAETVSDEWWQVRPSAYAAYLEALREHLDAVAIPFETAPTSQV